MAERTTAFLVFLMVLKHLSLCEEFESKQHPDDIKIEFCDGCQIFFGGLFPVHAPKPGMISIDPNKIISNATQDEENFFINNCGEIKKERGIQRLEAMLYAIDLINNDTKLLKNVKLGVKIFDTCDRDTIALDKCLNFLNDRFLLNTKDIADDFLCEDDDEGHVYHPRRNDMAIYKRQIVGVIGAASSSVSVQVANLLRLFKVNAFFWILILPTGL
jgi:hypothetical protein